MLSVLKSIGVWLIKNPAIFMTAIISIMFVMVVVSKNSEINTLASASEVKDKRIETLITSLGQARANVTTLNDQLIRQNGMIADLKLQGDKAGAKFDTIIAGMAAANATTAKKLDIINKAKPGPDKCASALELIKGSAK